MNVTIKDVAKVANVSYSTVSRALSGSNQVSEETRKKILHICKEVGYTPNAMARSLVTNTNNTIALIIPDISNPFYSEVAYAVENEARNREYTVFLCNTNFEKERTETYFKLLMEKRVAGIIVASASEEIIQLIKEYHKNIPIIHIGSTPNNKEMSYVTTDNVKAGYMATNYLLELGHKKIAFIGGTGVSNSYRERLRGFKLAMEDKQVVPDIELIRNYDVNKIESGYKITKLMIKENNIPTAIIATNDLVALGVIEACDELGLNIPDDISLIGFDDIPYASLPKIKLTTVAQSKYDLGRIAVEIIFKSQKTDLSKNIFKEVLQPELIIRSTCKKI